MTKMILILVAALLAGCGPSAQTRRACEMYVDAGGTPLKNETVTEWVTIFSRPDQIEAQGKLRAEWEISARERMQKYPTVYRDPAASAREETDRMLPNQTPQERAEQQASWGREKNGQARAVVALRLALSQAEVRAALVTCGDKLIAQAYKAKLDEK